VATILCIDDEVAGLKVRRLLLESAGHRVLEAPNGQDGIKIFRSQPVDLVILDYWMPGMRGTDVAGELKRINPAVPIVILSALAQLPGESAMADRWLLKGYSAKDLLETVDVLSRRLNSASG